MDKKPTQEQAFQYLMNEVCRGKLDPSDPNIEVIIDENMEGICELMQIDSKMQKVIKHLERIESRVQAYKEYYDSLDVQIGKQFFMDYGFTSTKKVKVLDFNEHLVLVEYRFSWFSKKQEWIRPHRLKTNNNDTRTTR